MLEILGIVFFCLILLIGVVVIPFNIAGTFIIVADALIYGLVTRFSEITLSLVIILLSMAIGMEILEAIFGALLARRYGGSKWGMLGAMIGGTAGAIIGTPLMPVLGTLTGAFLGSFIGAMTFEFLECKEYQRAIRVGFGAFLGVVSGKVTKIFVALLMVFMIGIRLI
jgi:uncharacterized protein YqgC (DUF456 family)